MRLPVPFGVFAFFALFGFSLAHAAPREEVLSKATQAIALSADTQNLAKQKQAEELLSGVRQAVQSDLKSGNPEAAVDIFLLTDGLLNEDIVNLRSLLASSDADRLSNDYGAFMSQRNAELMAYALKQNRGATRTLFRIEHASSKTCSYRLNGLSLKNLHEFSMPAGIPFYVGVYCTDHTFAVRQVASEYEQKNDTLFFSEFRKIESPEYLASLGVPNPGATPAPVIAPEPAAVTPQAAPPVVAAPQVAPPPAVETASRVAEVSPPAKTALAAAPAVVTLPRTESSMDHWVYAAGLGLQFESGSLSDRSVSNIGVDGLWFYLNFTAQKDWLVWKVDFAPVQRLENVAKSSASYTGGPTAPPVALTVYEGETRFALWTRWSVGFADTLGQTPSQVEGQWAWYAAVNPFVSWLQTFGADSSSESARFGVGAEGQIGPRFYLESDKALDLLFSAGGEFGQNEGGFFGVQVRTVWDL